MLFVCQSVGKSHVDIDMLVGDYKAYANGQYHVEITRHVKFVNKVHAILEAPCVILDISVHYTIILQLDATISLKKNETVFYANG